MPIAGMPCPFRRNTWPLCVVSGILSRALPVTVGLALVSALFDACRKLHVAAVHVEVGPGNVAASRLYQTFGLRGQSAERETLTVQLGVLGST